MGAVYDLRPGVVTMVESENPGLQVNYIDLAKDWNVFFKYEHEYKDEAHPQGTTIWFGVIYTFRIPKPVAK